MVGICGCSFGTWFLFTGNECAGLRLICGWDMRGAKGREVTEITSVRTHTI